MVVVSVPLPSPVVALELTVDPVDSLTQISRRLRAVTSSCLQRSSLARGLFKLGRKLCETPVGFKWFAPGLFDGSFGFGGEESAGASFLRRDGTVWTTDKDGPIMDLWRQRSPRARTRIPASTTGS